MHFLQAINSDLSVLIVCYKTGGTIKGDIKKIRSNYGRCSDIDLCLLIAYSLTVSNKILFTSATVRLLPQSF